jgi:molybdopterin adenylyltransferase
MSDSRFPISNFQFPIGNRESGIGDPKPTGGTVVSLNISTETGTIKTPVAEATFDARGIVGDAHAGAWHRQVSMLGQETIDQFIEASSRQTAPGEFAENITSAGIDLAAAAILDRFRIGAVELELTQIGKKCHGDGCAIYQEVGNCVMPKQGVFCRVVSPGKAAPGDAIEYLPRPLRVLTITLSDRASAGEYEDRSGPRARQILAEFFGPSRWHEQIDGLLIADDAERLAAELTRAVDDGVDVVFTLGGTGVGPRDITPETVRGVCEKIVSGIMENIRLKFGAAKPSALLSRSVAGVAGRTQIYALPGSVRAVEEYLGEILKTLEHTICMLHGLDTH